MKIRSTNAMFDRKGWSSDLNPVGHKCWLSLLSSRKRLLGVYSSGSMSLVVRRVAGSVNDLRLCSGAMY